MKIWLTTDTHFSYTQILEYCRDEGYEEKIKKQLSLLQNVDMLIHLGDVCIGDDIKNNLRFKENVDAKRLILIKGNHDRKSYTWYINHGWDCVCERMDIKMHDKRICFTHIPIEYDGTFDLNIHGHCHIKPDPLFVDEYHKLLSLEATDYMPQRLQKFIY